MPHFARQAAPFEVNDKNYRKFRKHVREDFREQCAYCLVHEDLGHGEENYELDHFRPKSLFPDLLCVFANIYYACHRCNNIKRDKWPAAALEAKGVRFIDFCSDEFADHFDAVANGMWKPLSVPAGYTEEQLRLNSPHLVKIRAFFAKHGVSFHGAPVEIETMRLLIR